MRLQGSGGGARAARGRQRGSEIKDEVEIMLTSAEVKVHPHFWTVDCRAALQQESFRADKGHPRFVARVDLLIVRDNGISLLKVHV